MAPESGADGTRRCLALRGAESAVRILQRGPVRTWRDRNALNEAYGDIVGYLAEMDCADLKGDRTDGLP